MTDLEKDVSMYETLVEDPGPFPSSLRNLFIILTGDPGIPRPKLLTFTPRDQF